MIDNSKYHNSFLFQAIEHYSALSQKLKDCTTYGTFLYKLKNDYF